MDFAINDNPNDQDRCFINRSWRFTSAYRWGLTGRAAEWVVKKQRGCPSVSEEAYRAKCLKRFSSPEGSRSMYLHSQTLHKCRKFLARPKTSPTSQISLDLKSKLRKNFLFSPPAVLRALGVRDCIPGSQNWYAAVFKFSIGGP